MGLTGCYACLKYLVVIVNFIFWLAGLAVLSLAIWMLTDPTFYLSMTQAEQHYYMGIYIFLAAGLLMFIMGFLGCCGAYKESPCMLISFFCFLLIVLVAEVAAGCWAYSHSTALENYVRENVKYTIEEEYGVIDSRTRTFDEIQRKLECCGANSLRDWSNSRYKDNNKDEPKGFIDLSIAAVTKSYYVPPSCCRTNDVDCLRGDEKVTVAGSILKDTYFSTGCIDKLLEALRDNMTWVVGIGIGIGIIELLGLIFSLVLCCAIRSVDRYKN